jgi:hypothetical protein
VSRSRRTTHSRNWSSAWRRSWAGARSPTAATSGPSPGLSSAIARACNGPYMAVAGGFRLAFWREEAAHHGPVAGRLRTAGLRLPGPPGRRPGDVVAYRTGGSASWRTAANVVEGDAQEMTRPLVCIDVARHVGDFPCHHQAPSAGARHRHQQRQRNEHDRPQRRDATASSPHAAPWAPTMDGLDAHVRGLSDPPLMGQVQCSSSCPTDHKPPRGELGWRDGSTPGCSTPTKPGSSNGISVESAARRRRCKPGWPGPSRAHPRP